MDITESACANAAETFVNKDEKRRNQRFACKVPVELKVPGKNYLAQCATTDISMGGCYISSAFPLPRGAQFSMKIWINGVPAATEAIARTSDPGVGNGIQFRGLDEAGEQMLAKYLETLEPKATDESDTSLLSQLIS